MKFFLKKKLRYEKQIASKHLGILNSDEIFQENAKPPRSPAAFIPIIAGARVICW